MAALAPLPGCKRVVEFVCVCVFHEDRPIRSVISFLFQLRCRICVTLASISFCEPNSKSQDARASEYRGGGMAPRVFFSVTNCAALGRCERMRRCNATIICSCGTIPVCSVALLLSSASTYCSITRNTP